MSTKAALVGVGQTVTGARMMSTLLNWVRRRFREFQTRMVRSR